MSTQHFTTGQVANYCGVTLRTVINWIKKGILKAHQLPGTRGDNRVRLDDLLRFMEENNIPVPSELKQQKQPVLTNNRAMVVDDDPHMARSISRLLRSIQLQVVAAHDGFNAGMAYVRYQPAIMTLDLQMPRVDGFSLLKQLKEETHCKIIVISGSSQSNLQRALDMGADAAFAKPFDDEALLECVRSLLRTAT